MKDPFVDPRHPAVRAKRKELQTQRLKSKGKKGAKRLSREEEMEQVREAYFKANPAARRTYDHFMKQAQAKAEATA